MTSSVLSLLPPWLARRALDLGGGGGRKGVGEVREAWLDYPGRDRELIAGEKHHIHKEAGQGQGQESLHRELRKGLGDRQREIWRAADTGKALALSTAATRSICYQVPASLVIGTPDTIAYPLSSTPTLRSKLPPTSH